MNPEISQFLGIQRRILAAMHRTHVVLCSFNWIGSSSPKLKSLVHVAAAGSIFSWTKFSPCLGVDFAILALSVNEFN